MGLSTVPKISELININGLYEKSQEFLDSLNKSPSAGGEVVNKVIPMYETRPEMINQDVFYGSDYFFKQVNYTPEQPVLVIGDNYFISELIRRQINESVGNYFQVKYNVEGAGLVKALFDNVSEVINSDLAASMEVGKKLTEEQINALDRDIVWFVTEQVDGHDVLVPHVYLAKSSLEDIQQGTVTGIANIDAGNNIVVDAESINNTNGVITAKNDVKLIAENDITSISNGMNGGIKAGNNLGLRSKQGDIVNSGSGLTSGNDITLIAEKGNVELIASVGRDDEGRQKIGAYDDDVNAGNNINIVAKDISITGIDLNGGDAEDSQIYLKATDGSVKFNDVHEISSTYDSTLEKTGFLSTRMTETTTLDAKSKTSGVHTAGNFIVDASKDVVFHGGEYDAGNGYIKAGNDVKTITSQDHHIEKKTVTESSFDFGFTADLPGLEKINGNANSLTGYDEEHTNEYTSGGSESNLSNTNGKRPGVAPTASLGGFNAGLKRTKTTTEDTSIVNKNAAFNFTNNADFEAGNVLDIGGMDLTVGENGTANLSAENIISTKYKDVESHKESYEEKFYGLKSEVHSSVIDSVNKSEVLAKKSLEEGMEIDKGMTAVQGVGDLTNLALNDTIGVSHSLGYTGKNEDKSSVSTRENINTIKGGTINLNSRKDTTLKGVDIGGGEVNIKTGGDFSLTAAETIYSEQTSSSMLHFGVSGGAGAGPTGIGGGVSVDHNGSNARSQTNSTSYANSSIVANNVNIDVGKDMNLKAANILAGVADVKVVGDLNIESLQDKSDSTASSEHWGVSGGIGITGGGMVMPTFSGHAGLGSEEHTSNTTANQAGIHTSEELNIKTGGDLDLTGGHILSDNETGSVEVGGNINAKDLVDTIDSEGKYGGGGGGISYKGTPMVNGYLDTVDTVHYKEEQHATINVPVTKGEVNGSLSTDADNLSTVTEDTNVAGNNISITLPVNGFKGNKGNKNKKTDQPEMPSHNTPPSAPPAAPSHNTQPSAPSHNTPPVTPKPVKAPSIDAVDGPAKPKPNIVKPAPEPSFSKPTVTDVVPTPGHAVVKTDPSPSAPAVKPVVTPGADVVDGPAKPKPNIVKPDPEPNFSKPTVTDVVPTPGHTVVKTDPSPSAPAVKPVVTPGADVVDGPAKPGRPAPAPATDGGNVPTRPAPAVPKPIDTPDTSNESRFKFPVTNYTPIISTHGSHAAGHMPGSVRPTTNAPGGGTSSDKTNGGKTNNRPILISNGESGWITGKDALKDLHNRTSVDWDALPKAPSAPRNSLTVKDAKNAFEPKPASPVNKVPGKSLPAESKNSVPVNKAKDAVESKTKWHTDENHQPLPDTGKSKFYGDKKPSIPETSLKVDKAKSIFEPKTTWHTDENHQPLPAKGNTGKPAVKDLGTTPGVKAKLKLQQQNQSEQAKWPTVTDSGKSPDTAVTGSGKTKRYTN